MVVEDQGASFKGSLERRYDYCVYFDILDFLLSIFALIYSIFGDFWIELVFAELIGDVFFSVSEYFNSEFLFKLRICLVGQRLGMPDKINHKLIIVTARQIAIIIWQTPPIE